MPDPTLQRLADIERALLGETPLPDCLRMCLAIGTEVRSVRLREWAQRELNGYRADDALPAYRTVGAALLGDVHRGPAHRQHERIAMDLVPDEVRKILIEMDGRSKVRDSVAEIAAIVARANQHSRGLIVFDVPDESRLRAAIAENAGSPVYSRIYWSIAAAAYEGLLDRVRTAAVSIVMEVRAEAGEAQQGADGAAPLSAAADQAVALHVSGSNNQIQVNQAGRGNAGASRESPDNENVARSSLRWTRRQTLWTIAGFFVTLISILVAVLLG
ncbi:hypothetical protein OHQ88_33660 (plasmid) [Micromonospora zamorensis]|uniref:AbiTii domain-containing protein n=1 Tax=Micromonospora zamorensis TaxID=709883 RepID=UPI002E1A4EB4